MHIFRPVITNLALMVVLASPLYAQADIYIQENTENEIHLTNLAPESETANGADGKGSRYVVLIKDEVITNKVSAKTDNIKYQPNQNFADAVAYAAKKTAVEPALLHAVIRVESNYNPKAVSPRGARGLMQLMPATAKRFNVSNPEDPRQNVLAGAQYLRELQTLFNGNMQLVLAAYNAGPNAVVKYGSRIPPYLETQQYVPKVLRLYQQLVSGRF
jgi:soluble lytic murein transglycosylase-like protein